MAARFSARQLKAAAECGFLRDLGIAHAPPPSPLRWGRDRGMDTGRAE
jgi:hypothetical protein